MSDIFLFNGFIIQDGPSKLFGDIVGYNGAASRKSWPLFGLNLPRAKELTKATDEWFSFRYGDSGYAFEVVPDELFVKDYLEFCKSISIDCRVLVCKSVRASPVIINSENLVGNVNFLGWDYVSELFDYSTIADELFDSVPEPFEKFNKLLNPNGLFSTIEKLRGYVKERSRLIAHGYKNIDQYTDYCEVGLYEVDGAYFSKRY